MFYLFLETDSDSQYVHVHQHLSYGSPGLSLHAEGLSGSFSTGEERSTAASQRKSSEQSLQVFLSQRVFLFVLEFNENKTYEKQKLEIGPGRLHQE